jgi:hypothetical protein
MNKILGYTEMKKSKLRKGKGRELRFLHKRR